MRFSEGLAIADPRVGKGVKKLNLKDETQISIQFLFILMRFVLVVRNSNWSVVGSQVGADYDPKQSGSPWSYLALVMEALSKEQGAAIVAGTRKVAGRAFLGWLAVSLR